MADYTNTEHQFKHGDAAIFCSVPDYDYIRGIYQPGIVDVQHFDGQVLMMDGSRTHAKYLWHSLADIKEHLDGIAEMEAADDRLLRYAQ
jgi:hypothetical protein